MARYYRFGFLGAAGLLPVPAALQSVRHRRRQCLMQQQAASQTNKGATANDNPPWNTPNAEQCRAGRQGPLHHQFPRHVQRAAVGRRDHRRQDGAGQPETLLALQRGQHPRLSRQDGAEPDRDQRPACRAQRPVPDRPGAGSAISGLDQLQQFHPAGGQAVRHGHVRAPTIAFSDFTYATKQLVTNANLNNPLPGLSASDSFTIASRRAAPPPMSRSICPRCRAR